MSINTKKPEMKITKIPNIGASIAIATTSVLAGGALGALGMWVFRGLKKTKLFKKKKVKNNDETDETDTKKKEKGVTVNINGENTFITNEDFQLYFREYANGVHGIELDDKLLEYGIKLDYKNLEYLLPEQQTLYLMKLGIDQSPRAIFYCNNESNNIKQWLNAFKYARNKYGEDEMKEILDFVEQQRPRFDQELKNMQEIKTINAEIVGEHNIPDAPTNTPKNVSELQTYPCETTSAIIKEVEEMVSKNIEHAIEQLENEHNKKNIIENNKIENIKNIASTEVSMVFSGDLTSSSSSENEA